MFNKNGKLKMKTTPRKMMTRIGYAVIATALLVACASTTLEQQIAVKEPGSWDFKSRALDVNGEPKRIVRIHDKPGKVGFEVFEYGQKHPCNQGFQKTIKTTATGLVSYEQDSDASSFACKGKGRYLFRADENGQPYEGWNGWVEDRSKTQFVELSKRVAYLDKINEAPTFTLVK
jgi:hypothetical protein